MLTVSCYNGKETSCSSSFDLFVYVLEDGKNTDDPFQIVSEKKHEIPIMRISTMMTLVGGIFFSCQILSY